MQHKRGLGKGMGALIPPELVEVRAQQQEQPPASAAAPTQSTEERSYRKVPIGSIVPNRLQPRTIFDEEKIRELADSIREQGLIQPLLVTPMSDGRFELIAGERRLRASRLAGLVEVPVVVRKVDDEALLGLAIIENIQREDLNPIEEARAFQELLQQFDYTQEDVAKKVGRSRAAVANSLRLLTLPRVVQEDVAAGRYSAGHARAILAVDGLHEQLKLRERIIKEMPTVRDVEKMVQSLASGGKKTVRNRPSLSTQQTELVETMKSRLGTKVQLLTRGSGGKVVIDYYSAQDLDRIYRQITV